MKPKYKFYATLLDAFQNFVDRAETYQKYYGFSETPPLSEMEWDMKIEKELIDRINRTPFESEAADKGTAFNEVVDCSIERRKSEKYQFSWDIDKDIFTAKSEQYEHVFPFSICKEFSDYFKGALTQQRVSDVIETCYGLVEIYGVIDELMPLSIHDIKTTSKYEAFKYKNGWQHIVYPYCTGILDFEYNITDFKETYTEKYVFDIERDTARLKKHCEAFIEFISLNENLITDKKIFNN
jgi:hypothetical protein